MREDVLPYPVKCSETLVALFGVEHFDPRFPTYGELAMTTLCLHFLDGPEIAEETTQHAIKGRTVHWILGGSLAPEQEKRRALLGPERGSARM